MGIDGLIIVLIIFRFPGDRRIQLNLAGFLNGKNARFFTGKLWDLLISEQEQTSGILTFILEFKKEDIKLRQGSICSDLGLLQITLLFLIGFKSSCIWIHNSLRFRFQEQSEKTLREVQKTVGKFQDKLLQDIKKERVSPQRAGRNFFPNNNSSSSQEQGRSFRPPTNYNSSRDG